MTALALTVLLVILWGAFIAFGWWHGGWRQIVLLAAMLLSYAVLSEWAAPNGRDLSAQFHWSIARTTTGVALLYLLVGTFVLGFLGSFALYRPRPLGPTERSLGAAMGVLNGGLLLALVLRTLRSYAFGVGRGQALQDSALSRFLIEDVGYLLLVALALGGGAAVAGLVMTRRDEAREMALLASVVTPGRTVQAEPHHQEEPKAYVPPPVVPTTPPLVPEPIYANALLIDWPANPPPGTQVAPPATNTPSKADVPPTVAAEPDAGRALAPLPARPQLPPRVPPPMIYPLAELLAASAKPAMQAADTSPSLLSLTPSPAAPRAARPIGPPPGATNPAFVPPTTQRPPPPSARQAPTRTDVTPEPQPPRPSSEIPSPVVRERDAALPDEPPPVVRDLDVTTQDVPIMQNEAMPMVEVAPDETTPAANGGTMQHETSAAKYISPPAPDVTMATAAIPKILPPPLPPTPVPRPTAASSPPAPSPMPPVAQETGQSRTGYARVAVARQAGSKPDESPPGQPQPSVPPEPLRPPLPTGPRVHPCPTCGYPIRDHARYCPNCGSRQGRP